MYMPLYFLFLVPHAFVFELLLLSSSSLFLSRTCKSLFWGVKKILDIVVCLNMTIGIRAHVRNPVLNLNKDNFFNCIIKKCFIGIVTKESTVYHHWFNNCYFWNFQRKFNLHWVRKFSFLPSGMCSAYMNNTYKLREIIQTTFAIHKI